MGLFSSVEFYVILAVIAAAVVAFASRPNAGGPVQEFLLAGKLIDSAQQHCPSITLTCTDSGKVMLVRRGIDDLNDDGAVSLAVKKKGSDIFIEERLTQGKGCASPQLEAEFTLSFMPPGRYHVKYNSEKTSLFVAFPFTVKPGISTTKEIKN